ncbi:putative divalent heavy-metal cations transporter [Gottschalkia purinilytica]|uniref:Putative divalent heavy-metal cations transporter n=1 Tax=Gottschalkia purinilytica TaxID=1503 RepID=A0A0L0W905_GOTPU|nr:ZIP family metal transporter [Gottschalkia purinilytica]KNF07937.1 putative divalent heavy-metal cations transporter [Gottschalkia purinilytica]
MTNIISSDNIIFIGILASVIAGLFTGLGALPIFFTRNISSKMLDVLLGFAAGVMLAATSFSLVIPSIEYGGGGFKGAGFAALGILVGGLFLDFTDKYSPHTHFLNSPERENTESLAKLWLFIIAITIHNFPEGLAVGVGFGDGNIANGITLAIGIGLQNMPEGLAVALALLREKFSTKQAFLIALATGLVEPIGGIIGVVLVQIARPILPFALSFAAGAMLFVISNEIIPETHKNGYERQATYGILIGFVLMMFLDVTLG